MGNLVVAAFVIDHFLRPEQAQHFNLLGGTAAPVCPILPQGLVLHLVPAHADAQPQPAAGQHIHFGGLLGDQGGLALGQDDDAGAHFNLFGNGGQIAEHHERLVEHIVLVVGAVPLGALGRVGAQHMVKDQQVFVAQGLSGLGKILDGGGVGADFGLGKDGSELHSAGLLKVVGCRIQPSLDRLTADQL